MAAQSRPDAPASTQPHTSLNLGKSPDSGRLRLARDREQARQLLAGRDLSEGQIGTLAELGRAKVELLCEEGNGALKLLGTFGTYNGHNYAALKAVSVEAFEVAIGRPMNVDGKALSNAIGHLERTIQKGDEDTYRLAGKLLDLRVMVGDARFAEILEGQLNLSIERAVKVVIGASGLTRHGLTGEEQMKLAALGPDKLEFLERQHSAVLLALATGGTNNGRTLEALKAMPLSDFVESMAINLDGVLGDGSDGDRPALQFRPLKPGDRIKSFRAERPGVVVKVYADGSAAVRWDDGTPQLAGLAHERVPRSMLVWVAAGAGLDTRREYALVLAKLLLNRVEGDEVDGVIAALEGEVRAISEARPASGLVAARYDAFSRFMMGGAK